MKDKSCHLKILFNFVQHLDKYCKYMECCCKIPWIFLDPFSIIYFSSFLRTILTNSTTNIFSTTSSNCRVKFKPLWSKTLNMKFVLLRFRIGFLLRKHSKVALITASFPPGRRFFHIGHKKRQTAEAILCSSITMLAYT